MRERGVTALEAAIVVALIGGFLGASVVYHRRLVVRAKEIALEAELRNLRASLAFFEAMHNGNHPASLEELRQDAMSRIRSVASTGVWPEPDAMADAFGKPYAYDPKTGTIQSQTKGYESW